MKYFSPSGEEVDAFQWIVDVVPEWWKTFEGVGIDTTTSAAIFPDGSVANVGSYIVRHPVGTITPWPKESFESTFTPERPVMLRGPGEGKSFKQRFWSEWIGKQIVLQCKGRTIVIGTLRSFENGFLRIEDAEIKGVKNLARVRTLMVDRDHVGHFHEPSEVEKLNRCGKPECEIEHTYHPRGSDFDLTTEEGVKACVEATRIKSPGEAGYVGRAAQALIEAYAETEGPL